LALLAISGSPLPGKMGKITDKRQQKPSI